jgi:HSP20 family protein
MHAALLWHDGLLFGIELKTLMNSLECDHFDLDQSTLAIRNDFKASRYNTDKSIGENPDALGAVFDIWGLSPSGKHTVSTYRRALVARVKRSSWSVIGTADGGGRMHRPRHEVIDRNALRLQRLRYLALQINHQQALALPGVDKADLEIQAKDNAIRSSGRKNIAYPEGVSAHRRERLTGTFDRTLTVPMQINADAIANIATACWRSSRAPRRTSLAPFRSTNAINHEMETTMSPQALQVQGKREVDKKQESTVPGRLFMPTADIFEDANALTVVLEMPGKRACFTSTVGSTFPSTRACNPSTRNTNNIGHYRRSFTLSNKIDQSRNGAEMRHGVLTVTLPKAEQAKPRRIAVN